MPVFAVIAGASSDTTIKGFVEKAYVESDRINIDNGNFFVFDEGLITPQDVCNKIIGVDNLSLRITVMPVESYWGVQDNAVWAWLGSKKL